MVRLLLLAPLLLLLLLLPTCCRCFYIHSLNLRWIFLAETSVVASLNRVLPQVRKKHGQDLVDKIDNYLEDHSRVSAALGLRPSEWTADLDQIVHGFGKNTDQLEFLNVVVGDPLQVFRLFRRVSPGGELETIAKMLEAAKGRKSKSLSNFLAVASQFSSSFNLTSSELMVATLALARIQHVYMGDTFAMAGQGRLPMTASESLQDPRLAQSEARLTVEDCKLVAEHLLGHGAEKVVLAKGLTYQYAAAIEWYETALKLSLLGDDAEMTERILDNLAETWELHDRDFRPPLPGDGPTFFPNEDFFLHRLIPEEDTAGGGAVRALYQEALDDPQAGGRPPLLGKRLRLEEEQEPFASRKSEPGDGSWFWYRDYYHLCRGKELNRIHKIPPSHQVCMYNDMKQPYLKIGPFKHEVLMMEPDPIYIFHDFVSQKEISAIKDIGQPRLNRSKVAVEGEVTEDRTANVGWVYDPEANPLLPSISLRMELATGLQVFRWKSAANFPNEAEPYQIGVYNPGGLYLPHLDSLAGTPNDYGYTSKGDWIGNRIATCMLYLSGDSLLGGGTVFPQYNLAAFPSRGGLIFWTNLTPEGEINRLSLHAGCPVIRGLKWVANKWIREGGQTFNWPCSTGGKNKVPVK